METGFSHPGTQAAEVRTPRNLAGVGRDDQSDGGWLAQGHTVGALTGTDAGLQMASMWLSLSWQMMWMESAPLRAHAWHQDTTTLLPNRPPASHRPQSVTGPSQSQVTAGHRVTAAVGHGRGSSHQSVTAAMQAQEQSQNGKARTTAQGERKRDSVCHAVLYTGRPLAAPDRNLLTGTWTILRPRHGAGQGTCKHCMAVSRSPVHVVGHYLAGFTL